MKMPYLLRIILVMLMLMLGLFARANEIDVEEQIQREENPYYLDFLKEKAREHQIEITQAIWEVKRRIKEENEEERDRRDYIAWRDKQPVIDDEKWERLAAKELEKQERQYLKDEKAEAEYRRNIRKKQFAYQQSIIAHNRGIASVYLSPRVPKSKRKYAGKVTPLHRTNFKDSVRPSPQLSRPHVR